MNTLKFLLSELERLSDQQRIMVDVLRENERLKQRILELEKEQSSEGFETQSEFV